MNTRAKESASRLFTARCCALMLGAMATMPAWSACPKLLMDGGLLIRSQTSAEQAAYWGQTIGIQGFLVHGVMRDWDSDVGTDVDSRLWKLVQQFQSIYSQRGVTDNFINVGLYTTRDWHNTWQNEATVKNFAHAATLAKHAGFKGIALDLEPYQPTWGGGPGLADTVEKEGRAIAQAMHEAYPDMTLVIERDVLHDAFQLHQPIAALTDPQAMPPDSSMRLRGGYQLAVPFLRGLLSVNWSHVVIATEETYKDFDIAHVVRQTSQNYEAFLGDGAVWTNLSVAPGLWPLGLSKWDKSARLSPEQFAEQLKTAFQVSPQYVWIYGYGSAWQTDGPYGSGAVTANFQKYVDIVHQVRASCGGDLSSTSNAASPDGLTPRRAIESPRPAGSFGQPDHSVDAARSAGSFAPAGTLPSILPLRPAGRTARTAIP